MASDSEVLRQENYVVVSQMSNVEHGLSTSGDWTVEDPALLMAAATLLCRTAGMSCPRDGGGPSIAF